MAERNRQRNISNYFRRKHLKKLVVTPLQCSIEMHARRVLQSQENIWNKVRVLEDSLDILAREFLRWREKDES